MQSPSHDGNSPAPQTLLGERGNGRDAKGEGPSASGTDTAYHDSIPGVNPPLCESASGSQAQIDETAIHSDALPINKDVVCCPCGNETETPGMIQCDHCETWQHYSCVGLTEHSKEVVEVAATYSCPKCRPEPASSPPTFPSTSATDPEDWTTLGPEAHRQRALFPVPIGQHTYVAEPLVSSSDAVQTSDISATDSEDWTILGPEAHRRRALFPAPIGQHTYVAEPLVSSTDAFHTSDDLPEAPTDRFAERSSALLSGPASIESDLSDLLMLQRELEGVQSSEDNYVAPKSRKKRRRNRPTADKAVYADHVQEVQAPTLQPLDDIEGENHPLIGNISRFNAVVGPNGAGLGLRRVVQPTRMIGRVSFFRGLVHASVVDDRQMVLVSCDRSRSGYYTYQIKDANKPKRPADKYGGPPLTDALLPDENAARKVGHRLCEYLSRLPAPLGTASYGGKRVVSNMLNLAVIADVLHGTDWIPKILQDKTRTSLQGIAIQSANGVTRATSDIPALVEATRQSEIKSQLIYIQQDINKLDMSVEVPSTDNEIAALFPKVYDKAYLLDRDIEEGQHAQYLRAANVVRYVQIQMYGAIGTYEDLIRLRDNLLRPFLLEEYTTNKFGFERAHQLSGPYEGKKLFKCDMRPADRTLILVASAYVAKDIEGVLPDIRIITRSATRAAFVMSRLLSLFQSGLDVLQAWRLTLELADRVNANLISTEDIKMMYCQCTDDERTTTSHVCPTCLRKDVCWSMSRDSSDLLICSRCTAKDSKTDDFVAAPGAMLQRNIRSLVNRDKSISKEDKARVRDLIWERSQTFRKPDGSYGDYWANASRNEDEPSGRIGRASAYALSIDGSLPFFTSEESPEVLYHADPENICLTAGYLNRLKGQFFPVMFGLVRLSLDLRAVHISHRNYSELLDQFDHFYVRTCGYKFGDKRKRTSMAASKARKIIAEMYRPIVSTNEAHGSFQDMFDRARVARNALGWSDEQRLDINHVIAQIEQRFENSLHRGPDGAPWLWIEHHMPTNWSWHSLWRLFASRLRRMRDVCNSKWETIDNSVTLLLECVYQHLKLDGRDAFLRLPMTIFVKHGLNFSIGHLHHGSQMRTGFKSLSPRDLDQDFDEKLSNICFETRLSNMIKWDHRESEYEAIIKDMESIHLTTEHYSVPNVCPRLDFAKIFEGLGKEETISDDHQKGPQDEPDQSDNEWLDMEESETDD